MMIDGISGGSNPYIQKPRATGSSVMQLEQEKKALQEEIERVKEDDKLQPEAKKKKLDVLLKKMQKIEEAIKKASNSKKEEELLTTDGPKSLVENLLDVYV